MTVDRPGILEALIPGGMQGHGGTAEVPQGPEVKTGAAVSTSSDGFQRVPVTANGTPGRAGKPAKVFPLEAVLLSSKRALSVTSLGRLPLVVIIANSNLCSQEVATRSATPRRPNLATYWVQRAAHGHPRPRPAAHDKISPTCIHTGQGAV
jgi:hypothetical protein